MKHKYRAQFDNEFSLAIDTLVFVNAMQADFHADMKRDMSDVQWAMEFATVDVNCARRMGKTRYIIETSKADRLQAELDRVQVPSDLIVVSCDDMVDYVRRFDHRAHVVAPRSVLSNACLKVGSYETIYVDEPQTVFARVNKREFYQAFAGKCNQFVMLGTGS